MSGARRGWRSIAVLLSMISPVMSEENMGVEERPPPTWDQPSNIRDAAERIAKLQKFQGAEAAMRFIDACYRTHGLATNFSAAFEACIVQDYLETKFLTRVYSGVPAEALAKLRAPSPELLGQAMGQRIVSAFNQYKIPVARAEDLKGQIDVHGAPVFLKIVFPESDEKTVKQTSKKSSKSLNKDKKASP